MSARLGTALVALLAVACMPARYGEPPAETERSATAAAAPSRAAGGTVVGRVSPEGTLVADTLAGPLPDTLRVERETVVTGEIRSAAELETGGAAEAGPAAGPAGTLATGWRVQVFASRSQQEAALEATRVREALADRAPVYVERDDPWFKVRVGDYSDRPGAERLRNDLAGRGWPDAWAVRTTIRTAP